MEIQAGRLDESDYSDRSMGYASPSTRGGLASCGKSIRMDSIGEEEYRCYPLYVYPNTWMRKKVMARQLTKPSKTFHDLRRGTPDEVGALKIEVSVYVEKCRERLNSPHSFFCSGQVLECRGLPKLDRFGNTDAYCFVVCGSASFITDVIPDTTDPVWLPLSRRACIAPVHNAYSQVYVGVFDYDGERETDDFAGRVAIDIPKLQAGYQYDFMLPLRQTSRVYRRDQKCGFIRLRLELNWKSERAALLTYLPRNVSDITKRMKAPREPVTVVCPDAKSFCNVATTVYGVDVPGRYNKSMQP